MTIIAAVQMNSSGNIQDNLKSADKLILQAAASGANLVVLPEMFATFFEQQKTLCKEKYGSGVIQDFLADQSAKHGIWIVGGTIPIAMENSEKVRAACLLFNAQGQCVARYDKIHLFDVQVINTQEVYQESKFIDYGDQVTVVDTPFGKLGLAVCYDIRFPELFRAMLAKQVEIIVLPSAFTVKTGEAHWEILVRAQAIINSSYLIAAAQVGTHLNGRQTYGHSMIVEPWGHVVAELKTEVGIITSSIDLNYLHQIRQEFPAVTHRRLV